MGNILNKIDRHTWAREHLSAQIDGRLADAESTRLQAHLAECAACSAEMASLLATVRATRGLPEMRAPRSFALTRAQLERPITPPARARSPRFWTGTRALEFGAMAAAVLFAALIVGDMTTGGRQSTEPVAVTAAASSPVAKMAADGATAAPTEGSATEMTAANTPVTTESPSGPASTGTPAPTASTAPSATATASPSATASPTAAPTSTAMAFATEATRSGDPGATATGDVYNPPADATLAASAPENGDDAAGEVTASDDRLATDEDDDAWRAAQVVAGSAILIFGALALRRRLSSRGG